MKAKIIPRIELRNRLPLQDYIPLDVPWVVFVDPSDICNFRCRFCPSGDIDLVKSVGRPLTTMKFNLYKKIIDDICEFEKPVKVVRLYKEGEPLINQNFSKMVKYAKDSGCCERVDTTTNASLLNPKRNLKIIKSGLDRINISVEGVNEKQYLDLCGYKIKFDKLVKNITHFYDNRKQCEMIIKTNGDLIPKEDHQKFYDIFGDIADGVFIEHTMSCWIDFDMKGIKQNEVFDIYGGAVKEVDICPYPFYSFSINSTGTVSLCSIDWARRLIIGDVNKESVKDIWNGEKLRGYQQLFLTGKRKKHLICGRCNQLSHGHPVDLDNYRKEILDRWYK
jgi:MoaA/NifB/PqqE/SkfB family radical SAM enzyme